GQKLIGGQNTARPCGVLRELSAAFSKNPDSSSRATAGGRRLKRNLDAACRGRIRLGTERARWRESQWIGRFASSLFGPDQRARLHLQGKDLPCGHARP